MAILSATWISVSTIDIEFDAATDPDYVKRPIRWTIQATAPTQQASVYRAKAKTGNLTVTARVGPNAAPGGEYTISAKPSEAAATVSVVTTCPANFDVPASKEWSHGLLRSLTSTFGDAAQRYNGHPQTLSIASFWAGDNRLFVESTLGFPPSGVLIFDKKRYAYTSL